MSRVQSSPFTWPLPIAAVWLVLPVVGAIVAATLEPIPPHDYWWHLAMGRWIDAHHAIPGSNIFLYTMAADRPFLDQPWLGQWAMWAAFDIAGHTGTVLLRNMLLAASFTAVVAIAWVRGTDARVAGGLTLLAVALAFPVLTVRTRMFAFLPFVAVLWVTFGVADGALRRRWLAMAPVATVIWANVHGSFVLAPAIVLGVGGALLAERLLEERRLDASLARDWGLTGLAVLLAGALTPHGFSAYAYVFDLAISSNVASSVTEWMPPDPRTGTGALFAAAVCGTIIVLGVRRSSVRLYEAVVFAGMLYLSASATRSMFWWAAAMPIIVAPHLAALLGQSDSPREAPSTVAGALHAGLVVLAGALIVAVQPGVARGFFGRLIDSGVARRSGEGAWVLNHENAATLVSKIRQDDRQRVFHDQVLGGMLEFWLTDADSPRQVAYVDQRMEFVPQPVWDRYFEVGRAQEWAGELDRWKVDTLLLSPRSQWPLLQAALVSRDWTVTGIDQSHVLLYRRDSLDRAEDPTEQDQAQDEEGDVDRADDP
jgi:hypothetical protein